MCVECGDSVCGVWCVWSVVRVCVWSVVCVECGESVCGVWCVWSECGVW